MRCSTSPLRVVPTVSSNWYDAGLQGHVTIRGPNIRGAVALALPAFMIVPEHIELHYRVVMRVDGAFGDHAASTRVQLWNGCMEPPTRDRVNQLR